MSVSILKLPGGSHLDGGLHIRTTIFLFFISELNTDFEERLGFIEKGMRKADVLELLGEPEFEDADCLTYINVEGRKQKSYRIHFSNGVFKGFGSTEPESLTKEDVQYIFDRFVEIGSMVESEEWDCLCHALFTMQRRGYKDNRILSVVRKRFLEKNLQQHLELKVHRKKIVVSIQSSAYMASYII
jgi:hypothetical protein